jgi:hypothetical protein
MDDHEEALARLTHELIGIGGPLASIVSHMYESAHARGEEPRVHEILGELLGPPLAGLADGWPAERINDAADVLHAACERVCSEIFLVPPPNRAARRRARRR